jgi:hypothetical protein
VSDTHDKDAQKEKLAKLEQDFGDGARPAPRTRASGI